MSNITKLLESRRVWWTAVILFVLLATLMSLPTFNANALSAPTTLTANTAVSNRPDNGHGTPNTWAYDTFNRKLVVSVATDQNTCGTLPTGDICYVAAIQDNGTFDTILGAGTPNGTGGQINHHVSGAMAGNYSLTAVAPAADTLTGVVPASEDDNFGTPKVTTTNWLTQAFVTPGDVVVSGGDYSWVYTSTCEKWTDASNNNDGIGKGAGNITGLNLCVVAKSNYVQIKNRATGRCLNENQATGLLSTYACLPQTYISLQWVVYTWSDGIKTLSSVQTGQYVTDNGKGVQLSLTSTRTPMSFRNGGLFVFSDNEVMTVNAQGNYVPVRAYPGLSPLANGRWDFGAA